MFRRYFIFYRKANICCLVLKCFPLICAHRYSLVSLGAVDDYGVTQQANDKREEVDQCDYLAWSWD